jgi:hypothetical protein
VTVTIHDRVSPLERLIDTPRLRLIHYPMLLRAAAQAMPGSHPRWGEVEALAERMAEVAASVDRALE